MWLVRMSTTALNNNLGEDTKAAQVMGQSQSSYSGSPHPSFTSSADLNKLSEPPFPHLSKWGIKHIS